MKNRKQTSNRIAALAAKALGDPGASRRTKALAGSALAQAPPPKPAKPRTRATAA